MAERIQRQTQKIFGGNAPTDDLAVFGSFKANNPIYTDNIEDLQSPAYEEGWNAAIIAEEAPFLEEMNGVQYGFSKQLAYLFQEGVPEYDSNTEYFTGGMAKWFNADNVPVLYRSLTDNNIGNPLSDTTHWQEWISGADIDLSNLSQTGIDKIKEYTTGSSGFNPFDLVIKDHVLSYEESKGFALQGTYVYKTPIAGSRYGYPDFVQKCLEEKNAGTPTETTLGESTITTYNNVNGHVYYNIADKAVIDAWFDTYGVADFYGVDEENERVFLPRNKWFMQLTTDISKVNQFNQAGLPNITGNLYHVEGNNDYPKADGAFNYTKTKGGYYNNVEYSSGTYNFDASRSSAIYGKSNTVQPPSSNKLLYYVVGNIEQQSAVTDVVDITTTENDTIPLFTGMYFDFKPNHPSWLKAGEQANSGNLYTSAYNTLVGCLNGTNPYNLKVIEESAMVSEVDYSEYWKVNQDGMYFVTPTSIGTQSTAQLYFKVANAVENLELLDVGAVTEALANKVGATDTQWAVSANKPDFSAGIIMTLPFTAPKDGIVAIGYSNSGHSDVLLNGKYMGGCTNNNSFTLRINKGDIFDAGTVGDRSRFTSADRPTVFYPMKGAK